MKRVVILVFILLILSVSSFTAYAQESKLNDSSNGLSSSQTETAKPNIFTSFEHWIANFSDKLWENVRTVASKVFDAITAPSHTSSSSSSSSSQGTAYHQLQHIGSSGFG